MRERSDPAAAGSPEEFEDFYLKEYAGVLGLAYALSGSRWAAEDLTQEAFLAAHLNWDRVAGYDRPGVWVRRVVANLSVSAFRRRMVEAKAFPRIVLGQVPVLPDLWADDAEFWQAVRSLPRRQAQVVALYYLDDRPIVDVAEILDMAPGTVKKHLYDGRRAPAKRLQTREDEA